VGGGKKKPGRFILSPFLRKKNTFAGRKKRRVPRQGPHDTHLPLSEERGRNKIDPWEAAPGKELTSEPQVEKKGFLFACKDELQGTGTPPLGGLKEEMSCSPGVAGAKYIRGKRVTKKQQASGLSAPLRKREEPPLYSLRKDQEGG